MNTSLVTTLKNADTDVTATDNDELLLKKFRSALYKYQRDTQWLNRAAPVRVTEDAILSLAKNNPDQPTHIIVATAATIAYWVDMISDADFLDAIEEIRGLQDFIPNGDCNVVLHYSALWICKMQGWEWMDWWYINPRPHYTLDESRALIKTLIKKYYFRE